MKKLIILTMTTLLFAACSKEEGEKDSGTDGKETVTVLPNHEVIYEINVRNFSPTGNFAGVTADMPRLKELGVDILWLMPIHPIGEQNRTGIKGSPYSVKNYLAINPDYGTADDLKALVKAAHNAGLKVWLDWVANHSAWDNVWVAGHIDYYASKGGQRPYSPSAGGVTWTDVVQLDYGNPNLRTAMIDAMKYWVQEFDIDGYRCDYTAGVPVDFWQAAIAAVKQVKPALQWLSEGDDFNKSKYFDYDYCWGFSDKLIEFSKAKNVANLKTACKALFNNADYTEKSRMIYITNHDLNAENGSELTRFEANVFPLTTLMFTLYDMPLLYNGQEIGLNRQMGLFDVNSIQWQSANAKMKPLVKKLIDLKHSQPALENGAGRGTLTWYDTGNNNVFVYSRKKDNNEVLVMLNFSNQAVNFKFSGETPQGKFSNWLEKSEQEFYVEKAVNIAANGYQVFVK